MAHPVAGNPEKGGADHEARSAAVFLTPAADDYRYVEGLIRELSAKLDAPLFEPHLTLCSGVTAEPDLLIRVVAEAARGLGPLTLRVRRIGCTEEYFRSIFIEFEPDPVLAGLHERLGTLLERRNSAAFLPHLSLLYREMPLADKEALARRLRLDRRVLRFDGLKVAAPGNAEAGWRDTLRWEALFRVPLRGETPRPRAVLFDFGGVLAEEGFREGLRFIALGQGLDPDAVHLAGMEAVYATGYVLGRGSEADFWREMRRRTGIAGDDAALSREILDRFVLRAGMLTAVRSLRQRGIMVAILSDQTDWLEQLDRRDGFSASFDRVFNSYRLGKGKRDPSLFDDTLRALGVAPGEALFVDDLPGNVERAAARGLRTILFRDEASFLTELELATGGE